MFFRLPCLLAFIRLTTVAPLAGQDIKEECVQFLMWW